MFLPLPPFHPALWIALILSALAAATLSILAFRTRPRPSPAPFSLRHAAILLLILIGLSVILSHGLKLAPKATPYVIALAAALSLKSAFIGAWSPRWGGGNARAVLQAVLETGVALLLFQWFGPKWFPVAAMEDMTASLFPAVLGPFAVALLCQFSNRATDRRALGGAPPVGAGGIAVMEVSDAATRAVLIHAVTLAALLTAVACCAYTAANTPLPFDSMMNDRALLIVFLTPLPVILAAGAALACFTTALLKSRAALPLALLLALAPLAYCFIHIIPTPLPPPSPPPGRGAELLAAYGLSIKPLAIAWGLGVLFMGLAAALDAFTRPPAAVRVIGAFLLLVIPVGIAGALCDGAPGPIYDVTAKAICLLAFVAMFAAFSRSSADSTRRGGPLSPSSPTSDIPHPTSHIAFPLVLAAAANILFLAFALIGRHALTIQAADYSHTFSYPNANVPSPHLTRLLRENGHALYMGGRLFAYIDPGVTVNSPDPSWRDMFLVSPATPLNNFRIRGIYPAWRINDKGDIDGRIPFYNSARVALFEPGPVLDQTPRLAEGVVVRTARPAQIAAWAGIHPANYRLWIGAALGLLLSILALHSRIASLPIALALGAGTLLLCIFTLGIPGVTAFLLVRAIILSGALAVGVIDRLRLGTVLLTVMSLAVVLAGVIVRMS